MQTNMNFPTYVLATVNPGLLHDRLSPFCANQLKLKLTLKPIPRATDHRLGFSE